MMYWYVWVGARVYKMFSDGATIRYEGNGPLVVNNKEVVKQPRKK